jgi:hypothetical protein
MQVSKSMNNTESGSSTSRFFLPQARLNKGQRKYCHCLMKSRPTHKKRAYFICKSMSSRTQKNLPSNANPAQYRFNTRRTNCVVNYQYSDYSLAEVQAFCREKGIPVTYTIPDTITKRPYRKDKLVEFLIRNYTKKHSRRL